MIASMSSTGVVVEHSAPVRAALAVDAALHQLPVHAVDHLDVVLIAPTIIEARVERETPKLAISATQYAKPPGSAARPSTSR